MKGLKFFYYNLIIVTLFFLFLELSLRFYFNQTKPYNCYEPLSGIMKYKNNSKGKHFISVHLHTHLKDQRMLFQK